MNKISFGTDGWRAVISDDFTFDNVKACAQGIAEYVKHISPEVNNRASEFYGKKLSLIVGYDTRFLSEKYAELIACVLAGNGFKVILSNRPTPTPSVSFNIKTRGFIGGVMVTASHNPAQYNGIKFKGWFGGSVGKEVTNFMESMLFKTPVNILDIEEARDNGLVIYEDIVKPHIQQVKKFANLKLLKKAKFKLLVDSMNGTGGFYIQEILKGSSIKVTTINGHRDAYFGGRPPEPNENHLSSTGVIVKKGKFDVGLATDGDADRLGVILSNGQVLSGHKVMTLLLLYLAEDRKMKGGVVQTICGTALIDAIAKEYGLKTYETPVGFKWIGDIYNKEDVLIGGEETGGVAFKGWLPERDGILSGLLILEMIASRKKSLVKIVETVNKKYGLYIYKRADMYLSQEKKTKLFSTLSDKTFDTVLGKKVVNVKSYDGFKFILENGSWFMLRASGTEPKLRVYSEGRSEKEAVQLIEFGKKYALSM